MVKSYEQKNEKTSLKNLSQIQCFIQYSGAYDSTSVFLFVCVFDCLFVVYFYVGQPINKNFWVLCIERLGKLGKIHKEENRKLLPK